MSRLSRMQNRALERNPKVITHHAAAYEWIDHPNAWASMAAQAEADGEARFDIEGALCWRDPCARRDEVAA